MITFEKFCEVVAEISRVPQERIQEESSFNDDLGIDSLLMVNLFIELTERFHVGSQIIQSNDDLMTVGNLFKAFKRSVVKI